MPISKVMVPGGKRGKQQQHRVLLYRCQKFGQDNMIQMVGLISSKGYLLYFHLFTPFKEVMEFKKAIHHS